MTTSSPIRLLNLVATPTTDPVGVALIVVFIQQDGDVLVTASPLPPRIHKNLSDPPRLIERCASIQETLCGGWCRRKEFLLIDRMASQYDDNYKTEFF